MDINGIPPLSPLESAKAILGEHFKNYVIIAQDYDSPTSYEVAFSDPYAAHGLLECANIYHQQYLNAGLDDEDVAWIWEEDDEEEED
jgi:hypothetical protein